MDKNTVCRWVRDYRRKHGMSTYAEEKGFVKQSPKEPAELKHRIRELEAKIKEKDKIIKDKENAIRIEKEKMEILKNPCTSSCSHTNEV